MIRPDVPESDYSVQVAAEPMLVEAQGDEAAQAPVQDHACEAVLVTESLVVAMEPDSMADPCEVVAAPELDSVWAPVPSAVEYSFLAVPDVAVAVAVAAVVAAEESTRFCPSLLS